MDDDLSDFDDVWGDEPDWFKDTSNENGSEDDIADVYMAQHLLILVDMGPRMTTEKDDGTPLDIALQACQRLVLAQIRHTAFMGSGNRDAIGVYLFHTNDTEGGTFHELLPLEPPDKESAMLLAKVQDDPFLGGAEMNLVELYGPRTEDDFENALTDVLFAVPAVFQRANKVVTKPKPGRPGVDLQHVWIMSNQNSIPVIRRLEIALKDNMTNNVELTWCGLPPCENALELYDIPTLPVSSEEDWPKSVETCLIREKQHRRSATLPLLLPGWQDRSKLANIQINMYYMVTPGVKPSSKQYIVHNETGRPLSRMYQYMSRDGDLLQQTVGNGHDKESTGEGAHRIQPYVEFRHEKIPFSFAMRDEIRLACNVNSEFASILVLGFQPKDALPFWHTMQRPYFCVGNEDAVTGSTQALAHLHASMLRKNVIAVCERVSRLLNQSRLVALVPLQEVTEDVDEGGNTICDVIQHAGFLMVDLPYEDERRLFDTDSAANIALETMGRDIAPDELVEAAVKLVDKATTKNIIIGESFANEPLLKYWKYIEQIALGHSIDDEQGPSELEVDPKLATLASQEIEAFRSALPEDVVPVKERKRKELVPDESGVDWEGVWMGGALERCRVPDLKSKLKSLGEKIGGNKPALIERLEPLLKLEFSKVKEDLKS